ncbi:unnamed protein product, partial [Iphiclides podalirius]
MSSARRAPASSSNWSRTATCARALFARARNTIGPSRNFSVFSLPPPPPPPPPPHGDPVPALLSRRSIPRLRRSGMIYALRNACMRRARRISYRGRRFEPRTMQSVVSKHKCLDC